MLVILLTAIAAICIAMFFQDVLGVGLTISQSRGLSFFPGLFDSLGDYANKYGVAIVAATTVHFGLWSWETFVVITCCALTSFFTSNLATGKESLILPKSKAEQVSLRQMWKQRSNPKD